MTSTKTTSTIVTDTATTKVDGTQEPQHVHVVLMQQPISENVRTSATQSATEQDGSPETRTSVHILIQSAVSAYMQKPCSIQENEQSTTTTTIGGACKQEASQIFKDLSTIRTLLAQKDDSRDLASFANLICPSSASWTAFVKCYCSKCHEQTLELPEEPVWTAIWSHVDFCKIDGSKKNFCEWQFWVKATGMNSLDIDGMFQTVWNEEMKTESSRSYLVQMTHEETKVQTVKRFNSKIPGEYARALEEVANPPHTKVQREPAEDTSNEFGGRKLIEEVNVSSSGFLSMHSLVFIWTVILATGVTIVSFFVLLR